MNPSKLLLVREVSKVLRCSIQNVYGLLGEDLAFVRVGKGKGGLRVRYGDLLAFLENRRVEVAKSPTSTVFTHFRK